MVPETALRWVLTNSVDSDVEIARLSNVCSEWRQVVLRSLWNDDVAMPNVLLPAMVNEYIRQAESQAANHQHQGSEERPPSSAAKTAGSDPENRTVTSPESFCAAWFDPNGIREVKVALSKEDDYFPGHESFEVFQTSMSRLSGDDRLVNLLDREKETHAACVNTWQGYRAPYQVLRYFGYAKLFVDQVFGVNVSGSTVTQEDLLDGPLENCTFAVRGATIARPESYCLCVNYSDSGEGIVGDTDAVEDMRQKCEQHETFTDHLRKQYMLQRDVLPRVEETCMVNSQGHRNRCIQFLNSSSGHSVCMMTPRFVTGPLSTPLTIVVVGICTEDGCFMSGLYNRCEIGHMHPKGKLDEYTEMSSICIACELLQQEHGGSSINGNGLENPGITHPEPQNPLDQSEFVCHCKFKGVTDRMASRSSIDSFTESIRIQRGRSGPGQWHVYSFIINGERTQIRVDGISENCEDDKRRCADGYVLLDGLTIGSDNAFDVSLCCGEGSFGEGEGAIAELAVFQGSLSKLDVESLEKKLMHKYGILGRTSPVWAETDFERQAEALYLNLDTSECKRRVPLHYMTRHRSVSWHYSSRVNGRLRQTRKIGSRLGAESSDWDDLH